MTSPSFLRILNLDSVPAFTANTSLNSKNDPADWESIITKRSPSLMPAFPAGLPPTTRLT